MSRIQALDDLLISKIAAGEVVERPASVIKELLENALDAGASTVSVELEQGGKRRIAVADDGEGMTPEDAELAFVRHATSKIHVFDDLERVATLGFRGEALASIASVSDVEMLTAKASGEAFRLRLEQGRSVLAEPASRKRGSTFEIEGLFAKVPARRSFLKRDSTELRRCLEIVQAYALARPEIGFRVVADGRERLDVRPTGADLSGLRERIRGVFGAALAENLLEIPSRDLRQGGRVGASSATAARSAGGASSSSSIDDSCEIGHCSRSSTVQSGKRGRASAFRPSSSSSTCRPRALTSTSTRRRRRSASATRASPERSLSPCVRPWPRRGSPKRRCSPRALRPRASDPHGPGSARPALSPRNSRRRTPPAPSASPLASPRSATILVRRRRSLSRGGRATGSLRLLGQYKGSLILLEGPDGLYLVDQHVAHERVLYERFQRSLRAPSPVTQTLLEPLLLELSSAEAALLSEHSVALAGVGIGLSELSGGVVAVRELPAALTQSQAEALLLRFVEDGQLDLEDPEALSRRLLDTLAASLSCRSAVKMHHPLHPAEMEELLRDLLETEHPWTCPHGRPVLLKLSDRDLESRFGRR